MFPKEDDMFPRTDAKSDINQEVSGHVETVVGLHRKDNVEILEFTHFVEIFSFNRISENYKEKELVKKVTVVVALDLGCGNTKNSEYESE